jgi:protein involved in polysaccharide export with SLBB domain
MMAAVCGCSTPPRTGSELSPRQPEFQAASAAEENTSFPEYRLGFGDVIEVKFFNNARFNETVTVRPDGRIVMEKIDEILVAGMTPARLDSLITTRYSEFILNPEVTVFVRQFGGYQVYVLGEVNSPGGYPIQRNMTVVQALAAAGGAKDTAQLHSVLILRPDEGQNINATKLDLADALGGSDAKRAQSAFPIQAQDVIYVPKTFVANVGAFLKQVYDGFFPPVEIYLRALWWSNQ